ncbi:unnamed protein product [Mytilus edulis]|uniref:EF-hand domain-containing protein n=1 Tax=Mytilus edulis TaxID=6550 RepID=A0A8S3PP73_MYTED|nr:unnamed protein product [Mytilus edulis]
MIDLLEPCFLTSNDYNLRRDSQNYTIPRCRTVSYYRSFIPSVVKLWNELDTNANNALSINQFKSVLEKIYKPKMPLKYFCSDVHSPIEISLKSTDQEGSTKCSDDTRTNEQKTNNWTNEKSYKFLECLNLTEIESINSEIDGTTVVTQETVDMIISKIGKVLLNSAGNTFGRNTFGRNTFGFKVSAGKKSEHRKNKPWFDHDCKAARSEFRKMKRNKNKSPFHRALVSDAEKRYKNTMNKAHKKYRSDFRKKMDELKQKDAKEFWRLLNENKSTAQPKIDFDKLPPNKSASDFDVTKNNDQSDSTESEIEDETDIGDHGDPSLYYKDNNIHQLKRRVAVLPRVPSAEVDVWFNARTDIDQIDTNTNFTLYRLCNTIPTMFGRRKNLQLNSSINIDLLPCCACCDKLSSTTK